MPPAPKITSDPPCLADEPQSPDRGQNHSTLQFTFLASLTSLDSQHELYQWLPPFLVRTTLFIIKNYQTVRLLPKRFILLVSISREKNTVMKSYFELNNTI